MHKTYLPLAEFRHLDIPIGDAFGGPAFGKREMPFIIGASLGTIATAVGTGVAAAGGAMAVAGAVASVATFAGVALTAVGAITGDKDLMKIGGMVGLAGGVGSLATSALSAGTTAATEAAAAGAEAATGAAPSVATAAPTNIAEAAITPSFQGIQTGITPAAQAAMQTGGQQALGTGTGLLGKVGATAAQEALTPTVSQGLGSQVGAGLGANLGQIGTDVGTDIGKVAVGYTPKGDGSFFDFLGLGGAEGRGGWEMVKLGGEVLSGMAQADINDQLLKQRQQQQDYERAYKERAYQNINTQGRLNLGFNAPSQAQRDTAQLEQADLARKKAAILTKPAGA